MTTSASYRYQNLWLPSSFRSEFVISNDSLVIPFLCDAAVFTLGGLMDSRFRGNDGWEPRCI